MNNSKNPISEKQQDHLQGKQTAIVLVFIVIATSFALDSYTSKNLLSLPLLTSTLFSTIITTWGIPQLQTLRLNQIIRKEGPAKHHSKAGTPTMGGLLIVPVGLIIGNVLTINDPNHPKLLALSCLTLSFMIIGSFDDWRSLTLKTNTGLNPEGKIALQTINGIIFLCWAWWQEWISAKIYLFGDISIDFGYLIWPLALFVLLAESNATNLTDGLDGLASGCGALVFTGLAIQLMLRENQTAQGIIIFCMVMAGTWLGFLLHNRKPARVFMGDTGSLAMGAALCGVALLSNSLWALFVMGGIFFAESLSVIIQVWVFKITKRLNGTGLRVFNMAPIHHHYELAGKSETAIVKTFWLVTLGLVLLGLVLRPTP